MTIRRRITQGGSEPSGSVTFSGGNWIFGGVECTVGSLTTQTSSCPYPSCMQVFSLLRNPNS